MHATRRLARGLAILTSITAVAGIPVEAVAATATSPGWSLVTSPNQPHATFDNLNGVSCGTAKSCVAVGFSERASGTTSALLEQWNGVRWTLMHAPSIGSSVQLRQVSCSSATYCMAVGFSTAGAVGSKPQPLSMSWNGHTWSTVPVPAVAGAVEGEINGVQCFSRTDCLAAGYW
jgi:hypothetical protein